MGKEGVNRGRRPGATIAPRARGPVRRLGAEQGRKETVLQNEDQDAEPHVDWARLGPALLVGACGGLLGVFIATGGGLMRHAATGFVGLLLGAAVLRALGLSRAVRGPFSAQAIAATIGAGAVLLVARLLA